MLNKLIRFSLAQRGFILMVAVVLMVFGVKKTMEMPVDVLPDLTKPTVTLLTEAPGYAPEEVETLITIPLENALMGVTGVNRVRTTNDIGLSLIFVEFDWDVDIYKARQFVQERLSGATETLPEGVTPYMTPVTSLMGDIMLVGLRDPTGKTSPRDLRVIADSNRRTAPASHTRNRRSFGHGRRSETGSGSAGSGADAAAPYHVRAVERGGV